MADDMLGAAPGGSGGKGGSKLKQFIKKNPTLSAIIGIGGIWLIWHETHNNSSSTTEEGTTGTVQGTEIGRENGVPLNPEGEPRAGEPGEKGEPGEEGRPGESGETPKEEKEPETVPNTPEKNEPGETPPPEGGQAEGGNHHEGINIHGKNFPGATASRIAKSGEVGGKKFIEYVITFPGKQEHWQYFPATGNWRETPSSGNVTSPNKTPESTSGGSNHNSPGSGGSSGGSKRREEASHKSGGGKSGGGHVIGEAVKVSGPAPAPNPPATNNQGGQPENNQQHPNAVNTGNQCVNGGVGGHTAPPGYHLFCQGGWIWRAPNS